MWEGLSLIKDDFGSYIIWDAVFSDLVDIESELCRVGSFYLLQNENQNKEIFDRFGVMEELLELEMKFTYEKFQVVQALMECYESITDVVEQH